MLNAYIWECHKFNKVTNVLVLEVEYSFQKMLPSMKLSFHGDLNLHYKDAITLALAHLDLTKQIINRIHSTGLTLCSPMSSHHVYQLVPTITSNTTRSNNSLPDTQSISNHSLPNEHLSVSTHVSNNFQYDQCTHVFHIISLVNSSSYEYVGSVTSKEP